MKFEACRAGVGLRVGSMQFWCLIRFIVLPGLLLAIKSSPVEVHACLCCGVDSGQLCWATAKRLGLGGYEAQGGKSTVDVGLLHGAAS